MEFLGELIHLLKRTNPFSLEEIFPNESKAGRLFSAVLSGKIKTDEEAEQLIYNTTGHEKEYQAFKRNLTSVLSEIVFNTTLPGKNSLRHQKLRLIGERKLALVEKLLSQNVYHNAEKIALKVKSSAERFQLLDLEIACIKHLRTIYTLKGYPKNVEFYNVVLKRLNKQFHYEQDAAGFMDILESKTKYSIGKYREIAEEAKHYSMQIREWQREISNPKLKLYQYKIDLIRCYHMNDVREWQYILSRITTQVDKHPFLRTEALLLYLNIEWARYMRCIANIPEANAYVAKALLQSDYAAFNRFVVQELNFDLKIKEENYEEAGKLIKEIRETQQFYLLDPQDRAAWLLREAYLYFIFSAGNDKEGVEKYLSFPAENFSVSDLIQACKAINKDKKGYNFMLALIKECLMKHKHPTESESGSNNLLSYCQRYMKDACEERSKDFLKRFARLTRSELSNEDLKKENKIRQTKVTPKNFDASELIPYESLNDLYIQRTVSLKIQQ